jgi:putative transposase
MLTNKAIKYRIYPTKYQERLLNNTLEGCRLLYNQMLAQRKEDWENNKKSYSCYDQQKYFKDFLIKKNLTSMLKYNKMLLLELIWLSKLSLED